MTGEDSVGPVDFALPSSIDAILDSDVDGLLDAPEKPVKVTATDRLERAFLEVVEFRRAHGRVPDSTTREIAERERVQRELRVAEQTVQQASKLAALGEMSAGVSHELNQPLAAMKTYLAGARLLIERDRGDEALTSFQRIDDLLERMGTITRQLKSYARKGGEAFEPVDLRMALSGALTLMESQLRNRRVRLQRSQPRDPIMVYCDRLRLEQVIINLIRNAMDATRDQRDPSIAITVDSASHAHLSIRDNGPGVADLEKLFEPFWTTKAPGEGTGLGLAISSGIVADFGGRLTAHNPEGGGAAFDLELPLHQPYLKAYQKNTIADLKNSDLNPAGASIKAALFLSQFVTRPWAHLDIAGNAAKEDVATGWGVGTLTEFVLGG